MDRPLRIDHTQRNQLWHIKGSGGAAWFTYTYDAAGNMTKRQDITGGLNDSVNVIYDEMNRVKTWENTTANDAAFARSHYTYDNLSRERVVSRDEEGKGDLFDYNDRNQLTNARYDAPTPTPTPPPPTPTPTPPPPTPTPTPKTPTPTPTPPPGQVAAPTFNPPSFRNQARPPSPLTVTLKTTTAGAVMYWTHNGSTPGPGNPNGFKINSNYGTVIVPAGDTWTLKAIATKSGMTDSAITSGDYDNTDPNVAPAAAPGKGQSPDQSAAFTAPAPRTVSYAFTAADPLNRDSVTENGVLTNYTANKLNQYSNVRGQALDYDNNFNLSDDNTHSFNAQNELVGVDGVTVQLVYDGLGRVLKRTINNNATIFVYDGWKVIEELDGSGNLAAYNIYGAGPDEILWRNQNGTALLYHTDKEGNVMFLLNSAGGGIERYTYDAFGAPRITDWDGNSRGVSAFQNRYMFNGKDYVAEMGLYDYRHRWYQPQLGRFLQVDPKGFDAGDENLFRYCSDDPVDRTDPEGLESPGGAAERAAAEQRRYTFEYQKRMVVTGSWIPQWVTVATYTFELKSIGGDQNKHVDRIRDENGQITKNIVVTKASLSISADQNSRRVTAAPVVDVYYADKATKEAKEFAFPLEPQHLHDIESWYYRTAIPRVEALNKNASAFKSLGDALRAMESQLRGSFNEAVSESHRIHDKVGGTNCEHCFHGKAFEDE